MTERPRPLDAGCVFVDAIEHAGAAQVAIGGGEAAIDFLGAEPGQHAEKRPPVCAHAAAAIHHLVENAGKRPVGGDKCFEAYGVAFGDRLERGGHRHFLLDSPPQVERGRIFERDVERRHVDRPGSVAVILEARPTARLRLIGVHRIGIVVAAAWMRDVIDAAAQRAPVPGIDNVEGERRLHARRSDASRMPNSRP